MNGIMQNFKNLGLWIGGTIAVAGIIDLAAGGSQKASKNRDFESCIERQPIETADGNPGKSLEKLGDIMDMFSTDKNGQNSVLIDRSAKQIRINEGDDTIVVFYSDSGSILKITDAANHPVHPDRFVASVGWAYANCETW